MPSIVRGRCFGSQAASNTSSESFKGTSLPPSLVATVVSTTPMACWTQAAAAQTLLKSAVVVALLCLGWLVLCFSERTVGVQQNAFHFVATPRHNIPAPIGGVIYMGCDDQSLAVRFPAYTSSTAIPETWMETAQQNRTVFKLRSSHWAFNLISNLAYTRWSEITPVVQQRIVETEAKLAEDLAAMDAAAIAMLKQGKPTTEVIHALTNFTQRTGDGLIDECECRTHTALHLR
jgi:hypothetical protein